MEAEFVIPSRLEDLEQEPSTEGVLHVTEVVDVAELSGNAAYDFTERVIFDLCENDALCICEQDKLDKVYSLVKGWASLESTARFRLVDSLRSNLTVLTASINTVLSSSSQGNPETTAAVKSHRSALKVYAYFLHCICNACEREAREAAPVVPPPGAGKGKKKAQKHRIEWDWDALREQVARPLAGAAEVDLWALSRPCAPDEALLRIFSSTAYSMLESPAALKNKDVKQCLYRMVSAVAIKYQQCEPVTNSLVDLLNKHEHIPGPIAELAATSAALFEDTRLAVEMLREIGRVDPREYKKQQQADSGGVKNVAVFLQELAELMPKTVATNISLLMPHLAGEAYSMRCAIVTVIGRALAKAYDSSTAGENSNTTNARLRSMQSLFDALIERVRDVSAYVRARVLKTWAYLCEQGKLPMGHWLLVVEIAMGRLGDKSSLVRKPAAELLGALVQFNPFGPRLPVGSFQATYEEYNAKLVALAPPEAEAADPFEGEKEKGEGEEGEKEEGEKEEGSEVAVKTEPEAEPEPEAEADDLTQASQESLDDLPLEGGLEALRGLVASLDTAVKFARALTASLVPVGHLLSSSTPTDVVEAIKLLVMLCQFEVEGSQAASRQMLPLVFSREAAVKDAMVDAFLQLFLAGATEGTVDGHAHAARELVRLCLGANLGELASLEQVVVELLQRGVLPDGTLRALWVELASAASPNARAPPTPSECRAAVAVLGMAALHKPDMITARLDTLLAVGFGPAAGRDTLLPYYTCIAMRRMLPSGAPRSQKFDPSHAVFSALARMVTAPGLPEESWYACAEQAIGALYALHPRPDDVAAALLRQMAAGALPGHAAPGAAPEETEEAEGEEASVAYAPALSRFMFVLGHVALQQLVHMEELARSVRRVRAERDKKHAEAGEAAIEAAARSGKGLVADEDSEDEDIAAQLGVGTATEDAELDALRESIEREILSGSNIVGMYAPAARWLMLRMCKQRAAFAGAEFAQLRCSAVLAMAKLMCVDATFCETNLQLLFDMLKKAPEPAVRSNLIISLGDLAFRFPNIVEPWTEHMYAALHDAVPSVRKNALMVLTHLVLNDMMRVKGHVSEIAVCLEDSEPRIGDLARLFFHELSQKGKHNPIYNLLPDMLSRLSAKADLPMESFQRIMRHLFMYMQKDKQADALVEKLCQRFPGAEGPKQWHDIAFCLSQLPLTEKGVRKLGESFKLYKDTLGSEEVRGCFNSLLAKARKVPGAKVEMKAAVEELEAKLVAYGEEKAEEEAASERARQAAEAREERKAAAAAAVPARAESAEAEAEEEEAEEEEGVAPAVKAEQPDEAAVGVAPAPEAEAGAEEAEEEEKPAVRARGRKAAPAPKKKGGRSKRAEPESEEEAEEEEEEEQENVKPQQPSRRSSGRGKAPPPAAAAPSKKAPARRSSRAAADEVKVKVEAEDAPTGRSTRGRAVRAVR